MPRASAAEFLAREASPALARRGRASPHEFFAAPAPLRVPEEQRPDFIRDVGGGMVTRAQGALDDFAHAPISPLVPGEGMAQGLERYADERSKLQGPLAAVDAGAARVVAGLMPSRLAPMAAGMLAHPVEAIRGIAHSTGIPAAVAPARDMEERFAHVGAVLGESGGIGPAMALGMGVGAAKGGLRAMRRGEAALATAAARRVARPPSPSAFAPVYSEAPPVKLTPPPAEAAVDFNAIVAESKGPRTVAARAAAAKAKAARVAALPDEPIPLPTDADAPRGVQPTRAPPVVPREITAAPPVETPPPSAAAPAPASAAPSPAPSAVPAPRVAPTPATVVSALPAGVNEITAPTTPDAPIGRPLRSSFLLEDGRTVSAGVKGAHGTAAEVLDAAGVTKEFGTRLENDVEFMADHMGLADEHGNFATARELDAVHGDFEAAVRAKRAVDPASSLTAADRLFAALDAAERRGGRMGPERGASSVPGDLAESFRSVGRVVADVARRGGNAVLDMPLKPRSLPGEEPTIRKGWKASRYFLNRPLALAAEGHTPEFVGRATMAQYPRAIASTEVVQTLRKLCRWDSIPLAKRQALTRYFDERRWMTTEEQVRTADARASKDADFVRVLDAVNRYQAIVEPIVHDAYKDLPLPKNYSPTRSIRRKGKVAKALASGDVDAFREAALVDAAKPRAASRADVTHEGHTRRAGGADFSLFHDDLFDSMQADAFSKLVIDRRNAFVREAVKTGRRLKDAYVDAKGVEHPAEVPAEGMVAHDFTAKELTNAERSGLDLPDGTSFEVTPALGKMLAEYREPIEVTNAFWKAVEPVSRLLATIGVSADYAGIGLTLNQFRRAFASTNPGAATAAVARGALKGYIRGNAPGTKTLQRILGDEKFRKLAHMTEQEAADLLELASKGISTSGGIAPGEVVSMGSRVLPEITIRGHDVLLWPEMWIDLANRVQGEAKPAIQAELMRVFRQDKGTIQRALEKIHVPETGARMTARALGERKTAARDLAQAVGDVAWEPFGKDATPGTRHLGRFATTFPGAKGSQLKAAWHVARRNAPGWAARTFAATQITQWFLSQFDPDPEKRGHFTWDNEDANKGVTRLELPWATEDEKGRYGIASPFTGFAGIAVRGSGLERYFADAFTTGEPVSAIGRTAAQVPHLAMTEAGRAVSPPIGLALDLAGQRFGGGSRKAPLSEGFRERHPVQTRLADAAARTTGSLVAPVAPWVTPDERASFGVRAVQSGSQLLGAPPPIQYGEPMGLKKQEALDPYERELMRRAAPKPPKRRYRPSR